MTQGECNSSPDSGECAVFDFQVGNPSEGPGDPGKDPFEDGDCDHTPLVFDLDHGGFKFTSLSDGVKFDLDSDGEKEQTSWIVDSSGDGFLVFDRNGNGIIDGGWELFGDRTLQFPSEVPNGFKALAMFDRPEYGGTDDLVIDMSDEVFPWLQVWIDRNHDGISDPNELFGLMDLGISEIELLYIESRRHDKHGNQLRYKSHFRFLGAGKSTVVDVLLLVEE